MFQFQGLDLESHVQQGSRFWALGSTFQSSGSLVSGSTTDMAPKSPVFGPTFWICLSKHGLPFNELKQLQDKEFSKHTIGNRDVFRNQ